MKKRIAFWAILAIVQICFAQTAQGKKSKIDSLEAIKFDLQVYLGILEETKPKSTIDPTFKATQVTIDSLKKETAMLDSLIYELKFPGMRERETKRRKERERLERKFGFPIASKIMGHIIWIGMTKEMAKESIGEPIRINKTTSKYGISEQWVYSNFRYLHFRNGILETIHEKKK